MLCEKIIGNISEEKYKNYEIDYVDIEWHDAFKKIHKLKSRSGEDVGIKLDDSILKRGLTDGDVLGISENKIFAVNIKESKWIYVKVNDEDLIPKVCYEIGNRHATLLKGEGKNEFITIYDEPMEHMLKHLGAEVMVKTMKVDFNRRISSSVNNHHH